MPSISSLITRLDADFPSYTFRQAKEFRWSPEERTVFYDPASGDVASLLHEVAHAVLGHESYTRDIELLEMERQAWQYASERLSPAYGMAITPDKTEDALDTYRDWLHARSTCPSCQATGLQVKRNEYRCVACRQTWRVNDARVCALRRYKVTAK